MTVKIQWLGHSSFRILGSKTIVTDPYGEIGLRFPDVRADIVTVSHGHHDHNAVEAVKGEPAIVDDAGMHKIADLSIMGYNTAHDDEQGAKRGHNIVFVIQMDGTRVACSARCRRWTCSCCPLAATTPSTASRPPSSSSSSSPARPSPCTTRRRA